MNTSTNKQAKTLRVARQANKPIAKQTAQAAQAVQFQSYNYMNSERIRASDE